MQKITKTSSIGFNLPTPNVKILQYNYYRDIRIWNHHDCNYPYWLLYWVEGTGGSLIFADQEVELTPEIIVMIPPHTTFSTSCRRPFTQFYLHFLADAPFDRVERQRLIFPAELGHDFLPALRNWYENKNLLALRLYSIIYEMLLSIKPESFLADREHVLDSRIKLAIELMNESLGGNCSNEVLCHRTGMSVNNFIRLFKQEMDMSPQQYRLNRRLEHGLGLLLYSSQNIDEIAAATGFSDRYHFSHAFRKNYGSPPAAFRRQARRDSIYH